MTRNKYSWLLAHISCSKCFWVHEGKSVCWSASSLALLQHPRTKPWFRCAPFLYNSRSHTDFSSSAFGPKTLMNSFQALTNLSCAAFPAGFVDLFRFLSSPTHHHLQRGGGKGDHPEYSIPNGLSQAKACCLSLHIRYRRRRHSASDSQEDGRGKCHWQMIAAALYYSNNSEYTIGLCCQATAKTQFTTDDFGNDSIYQQNPENTEGSIVVLT